MSESDEDQIDSNHKSPIHDSSPLATMEHDDVSILLANKRSRKKQRRYKACLISCVLIWVACVLVIVVTVAIVVSHYNSFLPDDPLDRANALLTKNPVIDGYVIVMLS